MSLLEKTKFLLRKHRSHPKRSFGQNFMVDSSVYDRMIEYASLVENDTVLDIGAGLGFLTCSLAPKCREVIAVEADAQIAEILCEQTAGLPNVKVIKGNALKVKIPSFNKIVSTPPYNISSSLLVWIFGQKLDVAVLVFQREFADRIVAPVKSEDYGWLAVLAHYYAEVELLDVVARSMFFPQPNVDSVIMRLHLRKSHPFELKDETGFQSFAKILFSERNRKIRNAILPYLRTTRRMSKKDAAKKIEGLPFLEERAREMTPEDFGVLANALR